MNRTMNLWSRILSGKSGRSRAMKLAVGALAVAGALSGHDALSDGQAAAPREVTPSGPGFAGVYGNVPADQAEFISTSDGIKSAVLSGAPSLVWEALEHGEKVECLDCISSVAPLLYDANAKTREIAAWWLRRRIFGVFGQGEVYSQTIDTLQNNANPTYRAYAAYALGEFFATPGIGACANALMGDASPMVRAAAASALGRLNDDGSGALAHGLADSDPSVALASLASITRINSFSGMSSVAGAATNPSADVRRRAMETLDALDASDSVEVVAAVAKNDTDAGVRAAASHALGTFGAATSGDASAVAILTNLAAKDPDTFVRDQAQIALQRL
jgi:HEAT repeat protein